MTRARKVKLAVWGFVGCLGLACALEPIDQLLVGTNAQADDATSRRRVQQTTQEAEHPPIYSIQKASVERRIYPPAQVRMHVEPGEVNDLHRPWPLGMKVVTGAVVEIDHIFLTVVHAQWVDSNYCEGVEYLPWDDIVYAFNFETQEEIVRPE